MLFGRLFIGLLLNIACISSMSAQPTFLNDKPEIRILTPGEMPYNSNKIDPLVDPFYYHDATGVRMYSRNGVLYDHPVIQASYGLSLLNSYRLTGNSIYLDRAKLHANRLVTKGIASNIGLFFPYLFDFPIDTYTNDWMRATWFSGMAQGQALSLFSRLYEITREKKWLDAAQATYYSFLASPSNQHPWIVTADGDGYCWIEEYPQDPSNGIFVLNGHIFALFGLYDYQRVTSHQGALELLQCAITTVKHHIDFFRTPGYVSKYCMRHPNQMSKGYHVIHTDLLNNLYTLTGDVFFAKMVDAFLNDSPDPAAGGTATFVGGFNAYKFD
jgi:hypothetical protein